MSIPSITYRDAIQIFSNAQDEDIYISHSLIPTEDKKESISLEEVNSLAQIAITGLKQQRQEHPESCDKLRAQAVAVRDYLAKVDDSSKVKDAPHQIFIDLYTEVETEIKQLVALEDSLDEPDSKSFSEEELFEIAKDKDHYWKIKIKEYGIKSQTTKIRLAKLAAQYDAEETSRYIKYYGIRDQEALIEIAKLAAQKNGYETTYHIQNFGINDQGALIQIVKLAAQENGSVPSAYFQKYNIKDQKDLVEIAKLAAQLNGGNTSCFIKNYGIKDQEALIEIAKLAAQQNGGETSHYIKNYGIRDQEALIKIAKLAAQKNGEETSEYIQNYGIQNKRALIEIAKLAVKQSGTRVLGIFMENYGIKDAVDLEEIFLTAFKNNPIDAFAYTQYHKSYQLRYLNENSPLDVIRVVFREFWPEEFSPIFKELSQKPLKKEDAFFLIYLGLKLEQKKLLLKDPGLWASIILYKDHQMRYELADLVLALDEKQAKIYTEVSSPNYLQLPALIYCGYYKNDEVIKKFHAILKEKKEFRDGMLQKALLDALHPLIIRHHFKPEEVTNILVKAFIGNLKTNLFSIQGILACGGEDFLRKEAQNEKPDLGAAYQAAFARAIPIKPIKGDFSAKYTATFGKCALPSAPLTYAGRLRQLPKAEQEKILPLLGSFIHSVLEGDFKKNRYERLEGSDKESGRVDHLKMIFDNKPALQKEWPIDVEKPLADYLLTSAEKISFSPQHFLNEKIVRFGHLAEKKYPLLYEYLKNKDPEKEKGLLENWNKLLESTAERTKEIALQKVNLRNAISSLDDIEKKGTKGKLEDIAKKNKVKAGRLLRVLTKAKKQLEGLREINESLKDIETLDPEDPDYLKKAQMYVDRFKKTAIASPPQLTEDEAEQQRLLLLQKDLIDLYRNEKAPLSQHLNQLTKIQDRLGNSKEEFVNDLKGIIETLQKQKQSYEEYTITNTDRFDLMFLCGTQVQGSCQRIDGDPKLNKCLLAYCLDGKNRLLAIKDKEGNIVARSILRLLWDEQNNCPALMQEGAYSNIHDESLTAALNQFAQAEAKRLGVAHYKWDEKGTASLKSFGGIAPWEYVDSAEGVHEGSKFTITHASKS